MRARLFDPVIAVGSAAIPVFVFAVMFIMVLKMQWAGSIVTLVAGAILGVGIGFSTQPEAQTEPV